MVSPRSICVVTNPKSGRNSRDSDAIERAMRVFGDRAELRRWQKGDDLDAFVKKAVSDGFEIIVAAGGDGTVMGVAHALMGSEASLAVLPLGTFNYFARGLGLPQEPEEAARAILNGQAHRISVGTVNGQLFLNNASLGIYPTILQAREDIYARWGRSRMLAHWSVLRTLVKFQRPMRLRLVTDGQAEDLRSPLIFVARSAYQLKFFGLTGAEAISDDKFAVFIAHDGSRAGLLKLALRLTLGRVQVGRDIELRHVHQMDITTAKRRPRVAFDGEKRRMLSPLEFRIVPDALAIILPVEADKTDA